MTNLIKELRHWAVPAVLVLLLVAFTVFLFIADIDAQAFAPLGYLGVFLANLIGSAAVIAQFPVGAVIVAAGKTLSPLLLGLVSGVGSGIGELTAYYVGHTSHLALARKTHFPKRLQRLDKKWWPLLIFILATIPNPIYDFAGIIAGMGRMRVASFLVSTILGRSIKGYILAKAGSIFFI